MKSTTPRRDEGDDNQQEANCAMECDSVTVVTKRSGEEEVDAGNDRAEAENETEENETKRPAACAARGKRKR